MIASLAAVLLAAAPAGSPGALPDQWQNWHYFMPVETPASAQRGMARVMLPMIAIAHAQSAMVGDLRIIDDTGREVPYVVDIERGSRGGFFRPTVTSDFGFVPGSYSQIVVDKVRTDELTDTLRIDSSESNYFTYIEVDASDDGHTWRVVRERAPIFNFERDGLSGNQTVSFPVTRARWLRVRVLDPAKAFSISGIEVVRAKITPPELEAWPLAFAPNPKPDVQQTWLEADAGGTIPGSAIELQSTQAEYHRAVRVSTSDDGTTWTEVGEGVVQQGAGGAIDRIEFAEGSGRYWRVAIFNHNDPPVAGIDAKLLASPRHVTFAQEPGRTYRVIYGNSRALAPKYDVADLTTPAQRAAAPTVSLEGEQTNIAYVSPEPWTERHPAILWIALVLVVVVMGGLAMQTLRR